MEYQKKEKWAIQLLGKSDGGCRIGQLRMVDREEGEMEEPDCGETDK